MIWLFGWLLFGMLSVKAVGGLPVAAESDVTAMLVIVSALLGMGCLAVLAIGAARRGKRGELAWLSLICLAGLLLVLWALHRGSDDTEWLSTLVAAEAYFFFSLCVALVGMAYAWRVRVLRRRLRREAESRASQRDRLDRMGMPINPVFQAMGLGAEDDPWPDKRSADQA